MGFQLSPGVNTSEIDLTNVVPAVSTSIGAFCGDFNWGPSGVRTLIDSENTLKNVFGEPTDTNYTSFFSAANFLAYSNNIRVVRATHANTYTATSNTLSPKISVTNVTNYEINYPVGSRLDQGTFYARYPGLMGNALTVSICSSNTAFKDSFTATANIADTQVYCSKDVSGQVGSGDSITIAGVTYTISSVATTTITLSAPATSNVTANTVTTQWKYAAQFDSAPRTSIYGSLHGSADDEIHVIVEDTDGVFASERGTILEKFGHASKASDATTDDGSANYYVTRIRDQSQYIFIANHQLNATNWGGISTSTSFNKLPNYTAKLAGGAYVTPTDANIVTGYDLFSNPDEVDISLIISGAADATIANKCLDLATQRKDCVAFVSPLLQDAVSLVSMDNIIAYRNSLTPSTSYSVFDSGWKYQFDKYSNKYRYIPLNADIAGLCARTDNIRDPWWSPAGLNRGQVLNAIKLSWNPSKAQRDELYKNNINPVVAFQGEGIVLYGDKTMQAKASAFDRINVRRLFIVLEKAIATAAKYSLFEFNDEFTRAQFVSMVEPFLRDIKGRRGIYAYNVVCDTTNNTPEVIDSNRFVGDIYVKPARSINFIQLNFVAVRTGVEFSEIAGKF